MRKAESLKFFEHEISSHIPMVNAKVTPSLY